MNLLKEVALCILTLEVFDTCRGPKREVKVVTNAGCLSFDPHMAIIVLNHAVHGFGL